MIASSSREFNLYVFHDIMFVTVSMAAILSSWSPCCCPPLQPLRSLSSSDLPHRLRRVHGAAWQREHAHTGSSEPVPRAGHRCRWCLRLYQHVRSRPKDALTRRMDATARAGGTPASSSLPTSVSGGPRADGSRVAPRRAAARHHSDEDVPMGLPVSFQSLTTENSRASRVSLANRLSIASPPPSPPSDSGLRKHDERGMCCGSDFEAAVLWKTIKESGSVTACAMVTTAVAFGASINSPISTIRQYALFQTLCVVVEFSTMFLLFVPAMVACRRSLFFVRNGVDESSGPLATCLYDVGRPLGSALAAPRALAPGTPAFWLLAPCTSRARAFDCAVARGARLPCVLCVVAPRNLGRPRALGRDSNIERRSTSASTRLARRRP